MREHLLGYVAGALEDSERRQVEAELANDPQLARQCAQLESCVAPLAEDAALSGPDGFDETFDPPPRLAMRTIAFVAARASAAEEPQDAEAVAEPIAEDGPQGHWPRAASLSSPGDPLSPRRVSWSLADVAVAVCVCAAAAVLFFPAIASSRQQAALVQCQNNLRQIGHALVSYSERNYGEFPSVPVGGNLGVAGVYAPTLLEAKLVGSDRVFLCPGSTLAEQPDSFRVPSRQEVLDASGQELTQMQRRMGGSYGYAFGYVEDDEYRPNVNRHRERFALLSDAPSLHLEGRQSANHGGRGQNFLFEDNHVQYLTRCRTPDCTDDFFLSDRGYIEAGRHYNDSVVAHSSARPLVRLISSQ